MPLSLLLLAAVPVAPILHYAFGAAPLWVFVTGIAAIAVLADWIRRATDETAAVTGPAIGGLLSVSFGSLAEVILGAFVLATGAIDVVRAQITGSILATGLFGLGLAVLVGGLRRGTQSVRRQTAGQLTGLLTLAMIALLLPALFHLTARSVPHLNIEGADRALSIAASLVLLAVYATSVVYTLVTRREGVSRREGGNAERSGGWPLSISLGVLVGATAAIALESELVSDALTSAAGSLGLAPVFLGIVVLGLVGTVSDLFAAVSFAGQDRMGLVLDMCVGSSIQVALVIAPLLVLVSPLLGHPMTLVFSSPLNLFAIAGATFAVTAIAADGETNWFEGVLLIGVYLLLAIAFFFVSPPVSPPA